MAINAIKDLTGEAAESHGRLSYNGIEFGAFRRYQLEGQHIYDEADRTVTHVRYTLTVACAFFEDTESSLADTIEALREALSEPGQQLRITAMGLGDIVVNGSAGADFGVTHRDVEWGPKPQVLSLDAAGGVNAIEVVWRCVFSISECEEQGSFASRQAQEPVSKLLAFNYTAAYRITNGLTTRNIAGYAQIPLSRILNNNNGRAIIVTADSVWDRITVPVPVGFRRVDNERIISADGARLDFSFTDTQLECPAYPPGIAHAAATYSLGNASSYIFERWAGAIEANYEVAPGLPKSLAARAFYLLLLGKLGELNKATRKKGRKNFLLVDRITARSELYTQRASFTASFTVHGCLSSILGDGGMWTPVPGSNYQQWATSMAVPWGNRGTAGLVHQHAQAIIDVCQPTTQVTLPPDGSKPAYSASDFSGILKAQIPPDGGWLSYENRLVAVREQSLSSHSLLTDALRFVGLGGSDSLGYQFPKIDAPAHENQYNGAPKDDVWMIGKALRVGHLPTVPRIKDVDKVPVTEAKAIIDGPKVVGCFLDLKVYAVRWAIKYTVDGYLNTIPAQPGQTCCDDETTGKKGKK